MFLSSSFSILHIINEWMINETFCYFFSPESRDDQLARLGCLITVTGDDGQQTDETVDCRQSVLQTSESLSLSLSL